jgi:hypothetical protein
VVRVLLSQSSNAGKAAAGSCNPPRQHNPSPFDWVYRDPRWKALRAQVVAECGNRCCDPEHDSKHAITKLDLDHIRELVDGGEPFSRANVMLRCHRCHSRKTKAAQLARFAREDWIRKAREGG